MMKYKRRIAVSMLAIAPFLAGASDHLEAPAVESDQAADIADVYTFLDPNDNSKVILAFDVHGFIVPSENGNLGGFDHDVLFRFNIENTGDAAPDKFIYVNFDAQTSRSQPQTAHISIGNQSFTAPTTVSSATAANPPVPVVTTDAATGISFFAGLTDDPFFFDIPGFNRFVGSVLSGAPNVGLLSRGRDSFAGYNIQMLALSVPVAMLKG